VDEVARAVSGQVIAGDPRAEVDGAAIDTRKLRGGELFFAFAGAQTDGHRFVADALDRGTAAAAIVEREPEPAPASGKPVVRVADTFRALHDLTRHARAKAPRKLVGITGSAGKTTTKELLAALLATRFKVSATVGNLNNLYGFPVSLLNVPDGTDWMVAEMGMSTPGELRQLSTLGRPDVALYTVVRPVHLEFFDSVRGIAEAKAELMAGLAPGGLIVANADDPEVSRIARRQQEEKGNRIVWYGIKTAEPVDLRARDLAPEPEGIGSRFVLEAQGESVDVRLPLHGLYNVENALAAAACARALGLTLPEIAAALGSVRPASMRGVVHRIAVGDGAFTLVDDSYNSNPDALIKALDGAAVLRAGRHLAVLGDMRELGPEAPRYHRECGEHAARLGFVVAGVGELARELVAGATAAAGSAVWLADAAAAAEWAEREVGAGDLLLVKGSRGVGLDAVVRRLTGGPTKEGGNG
jgi:UDP-N-acetylmuramoyl-tripeptide--D-alanyl-D-alanine ligase